MNRHGQPAPIGATGEIYIGGEGIARGYLNREALTAERFIADPFCADHGARLYRTGDLGAWRADGVIEYFGRNDHQIKIRGFRVEPGEIEAQLCCHPLVSDAAVILREDAPGEQRLVAYVIPSEWSDRALTSGPEELRTHLNAVLPEHMVPSAFAMIERFPLSPSGKLDRLAFPPPSIATYANRNDEPPQGRVETALAEIWEELLRVERIGRSANFFELGGHSLHGIKLVSRIEDRLGVSLPVIAVFQYPTVRQMAMAVDRARPVGREFDPVYDLELDEGVL
jgi:acyl carrier protein